MDGDLEEEGVTYSLEGGDKSLEAATGKEEDHLIPYSEVAEDHGGVKEAKLVEEKQSVRCLML